ncbi:MAG: branched-chain amino acid ABC transporter substrate-binding protein [Smithellaceae bacterium]|nr:branched-chain amino acid ABC transporter substrate-binding protein [Syntrophaceae bacterium]MDD4242300.1 branched-chain amino acid ABC transporter substrate-binding protein [Smithellaceae bacterium]
MKNKNLFRWTAVAVLLFFFVAASYAEKADTIKIGVAGSHTGDLASYGLPSVRAAELIVKNLNAKGGLLGKKLELIVEDEACKPELATNVATKLVSAHAHAVIGHICSGATKAALGTYKDAGIIVISPSATSPELTHSGQYPNFHRTIAPDDAQGKLVADFATKTLKLRKFAVLHDKGDYGKGFAEYAKKFLEASPEVKVVLYEGLTPGAVDYSAIVQKIRYSGAEAVVYGGYHPEAASVVQLMRRRNMKTVFISDDGVKDQTFIKVAGRAAEGVYASGPKDTTKNPLAIAAINEHKKAYGAEPGAFYLNAYSATLALVNAIAKAKSTKYAAVHKALRTYPTDTPLGKIKFSVGGDAIGVGFSMYQVKNGVYTEIK